MKENNQQQHLELEDDISLKDIFRVAKDYLKEVFISWKYYLVLPSLFATFFFFQAYNEPIYYPASVTFQVAEESDSGAGGISSILAAFGGGGKNEGNLEKILQLFSSRRIINNALFTRIRIQEKSDFLANHIINIYGIEELIDPFRGTVGWIEQVENLDHFVFEKPINDSLVTPIEGIMNSVLYSHLTGNPAIDLKPMIGSQVDEKSNIMRISMVTIDEDLTLESVKVLYNQLSSYYINNTTEKARKIKEIAEFKKDSIANELAYSERKLAEFEDGHRNLVWVRGSLEKQKLQRQARILEVMYGEVVKQLELSDFTLRRRTPYVSFIDMPVKPITPIVKSISEAIIFGLILGFFLTTFFIIGRKFILDALKD